MASWKPAARLRALTGDLDLEGGSFVMVLLPAEFGDASGYSTLADVAAAELANGIGGVLGYARQPVTWQTPALDVAGLARAVFDDVEYPGLTAEVGAWYIAIDGATDGASDLLWFGSLAEAVSVAADTLLIASPLGGAVILT